MAAVDKNWAIGLGGKLLVTIPHDQKRFRDQTLGKVIVMGRKTLESLPAGQPLYGRIAAHKFRQQFQKFQRRRLHSSTTSWLTVRVPENFATDVGPSGVNTG